MQVGVIGAGIGGLAAAVGLQRAGAEVTVFERVRQVRVVGAGLTIFGNGFTALDALGVAEQVRALGGHGLTSIAGQRDPRGRWLAHIPPRALSRLAVVHRADLQRVLLTALRADTVRYATDVEAVSPDGTTITLQADFSLPRNERFDLVIAADGLRSGVRSGWPADPGVRYAGYTAWRGVTDRPVELHGEAGETWGRGRRFGIAPLGDGRVYWFAVASMPPGTAIEDEYAEVARRFGQWHAPIADILAATSRDSVFRLDINELAGPLPAFHRGRCVLLGDAAHAMPPDLGQGGNQALEDAATLVRLIGAAAGAAGGSWLDGAIADYDRLRRPRTQQIARQARLVGRVAQVQGAIGCRMRDAAMRLIPDAVIGGQLSAIQRWRPPEPAVVTSSAG